MDSQRTIIQDSHFLTHLTNVIGSTMGQFAVESKLRDDWFVKHMRYIESVEDDEFHVHDMVKRRKILFINGLAIELEMFFEVIWEIDMGDPRKFNDCRTYDFIERNSNFDRLLRFCIDKKMFKCIFQDTSSRDTSANLVSWGVALPAGFDQSIWYKTMQKHVFEEMPIIENVFRKKY